MKCAICEKEFVPRKKNSKYCCVQCHHLGMKKKPVYAICKYCGKEFVVGRDCKGMYCSTECQHNSLKISAEEINARKLAKDKQREAKRKEQAAEREAKREELDKVKREQFILSHTKVCIECGKWFVAKNIKSLGCSASCSKRYNNRKKTKRIYRNGKPDLSISLSKLYQRDDGVCKMCGITCDWKDVSVRDDGTIVAGETYPSVDHIKPLAKGGKHEWSNVQLLCRHCNCLKRDT